MKYACRRETPDCLWLCKASNYYYYFSFSHPTKSLLLCFLIQTKHPSVFATVHVRMSMMACSLYGWWRAVSMLQVRRKNTMPLYRGIVVSNQKLISTFSTFPTKPYTPLLSYFICKRIKQFRLRMLF